MPMITSRTSPRTVLLSLLSSRGLFLALAIAFAATVTMVLLIHGRSEKTARDGAARFAAALVHNDPAAAPPGADAYVTGVRAYFGAVTEARVIGAGTKNINAISSRSRRSFLVAERLLSTARGPAVIELEFRSTPIIDRVSRVRELEPGRAGGLSARDRLRLASSYRARGGIAADALALREGRAGTSSQSAGAWRR
jgi:hypothetical protein